MHKRALALILLSVPFRPVACAPMSGSEQDEKGLRTGRQRFFFFSGVLLASFLFCASICRQLLYQCDFTQ